MEKKVAPANKINVNFISTEQIYFNQQIKTKTPLTLKKDAKKVKWN